MCAQKKPKPPSGAQEPRRQLKRFVSEESLNQLPEASLKKRRQILESAVHTFAEFGYQGTSMNLVADRAGVIKQTIYSHFLDKEALFRAVIQSVTIDNVRSEIGAPEMHGKPARDVLRKIAQTILARHADPLYSNFFRMMIGETGRFPELALVFTEATIKPGTELVCSLLRDGSEFQIDDPEAFARIFMGAVVGYSLQQYMLRGFEYLPFEQDRFLAELMRIVDTQKKG